MVAETEKFEKATLTAFYYTIRRGVGFDPIEKSIYETLKANPKASGVNLYNKQGGGTSNRVLAQAMLIEYPKMDYDKWYQGILRGAKELSEFIGHTEGEVDDSWYYGRFGDKGGFDKVGEIPAGSQNGILDDIWNNFSQQQKKLVGDKKDTWNPSDVYIAQKSAVNSIMDNVHKITCTGDHKDSQEACLGVAAVNAYLSNKLEQEELIGISLKQATPKAKVRITPTNLNSDPDVLDGLEGGIEGDIKTKMKIKDIAAGKHRWDTNSFTFNARFSSTKNSNFAFIYESKIGSVQNHASETRSRTTNETSKNEINHEARNGSVPIHRLNRLVKAWTTPHVALMDKIPTNRKFTPKEREYWVDKFVDMKPHSKMGDTKFHFGKSSADDITLDGKKVSRQKFMEAAIDLYEGKPKKGNYDMELISKLRSLRYFEMLNAAAESRDHHGQDLAYLVAKLYFMSSKINFQQGELAAPFIKIQ